MPQVFFPVSSASYRTARLCMTPGPGFAACPEALRDFAPDVIGYVCEPFPPFRPPLGIKRASQSSRASEALAQGSGTPSP